MGEPPAKVREKEWETPASFSVSGNIGVGPLRRLGTPQKGPSKDSLLLGALQILNILSALGTCVQSSHPFKFQKVGIPN